MMLEVLINKRGHEVVAMVVPGSQPQPQMYVSTLRCLLEQMRL